MVRRKAVLERYAAYGLWPGLWCAVRWYSSATRLCGASGTWYVSLRAPVLCTKNAATTTHQCATARPSRKPRAVGFGVGRGVVESTAVCAVVAMARPPEDLVPHVPGYCPPKAPIYAGHVPVSTRPLAGWSFSTSSRPCCRPRPRQRRSFSGSRAAAARRHHGANGRGPLRWTATPAGGRRRSACSARRKDLAR
eukprot:1981815-Prymnesium_polylepis.1